MQAKSVYSSAERRFVKFYKVVCERERFLSDEAKIIQYSAIVRYFMKFLQSEDGYSDVVYEILYQTEIKLGGIYYEKALQNQDNGKYFLATAYYNQALNYAQKREEQNLALSKLQEIYYYLDDREALVKVEMAWANNRDDKDKFAAFMLLAQNSEQPQVKIVFLAKALDLVMAQSESFYTKYQDTLNVCSQMAALYEILGEKDKAIRVMKLRDNASKLLN